jgi:hypothetical protein
MTDTTTPNGDRDRPSDGEAAKNPRGAAMGRPERTASSGSASPQLDMALLRGLAAEFGCYPASVKPEDDIERTRARLAEHDRWCATAETSSLTCEQLAHSYPHLRRLVKNERESNGRKHLGQ